MHGAVPSESSQWPPTDFTTWDLVKIKKKFGIQNPIRMKAYWWLWGPKLTDRFPIRSFCLVEATTPYTPSSWTTVSVILVLTTITPII
uniref:Uncharacterized protein n=1 Tax=Engystomops pustulosus TaxID=76066 RepID=A0AAV6YPC8_ENGPU|nr:hypothetical protein GDO81_021434 [Engystomops pustulosus]